MGIPTCSSSSSSSSHQRTPPGSPQSQRISLLKTPEKVSRSLTKILKLTDEKANTVVQALFKERENLLLSGQRCLEFDAGDEFPFGGILTHEALIIPSNKIGQGTYCQVFKAHYIPIKRHRLEAQENESSPSKPEQKALKKARTLKKPFTPEKNLLRTAIGGLGSENFTGIDFHQYTINNPEGFSYSVNELMSGDLFYADFTISKSPAQSIIKVFLDVSKAILTIHSNGEICRDIKGSNMLFKEHEEPHLWTGMLTDFDHLFVELAEVHKTSTTEEYADPIMFGESKFSLINQKNRAGLQNKAADVYALGHTIYRDVLIRFATTVAEKYQATNPDTAFKIIHLIKKISPKTIFGTFSDKDLIKNGEALGYLAVYRAAPNTESSAKIIIHRSITELLPMFLDISKLIKPEFKNQNEQEAFERLLKLSCLMRHPDLRHRPKIEAVCAKLEELYLLAQKPDDQTGAQSSGSS